MTEVEREALTLVLRDHGRHSCDKAADLIEIDGKRIAELEPVVRELAEMPFGGEVWERSKWLADLTKRARELLKVRA